jgi:2-iminoacetate synthase
MITETHILDEIKTNDLTVLLANRDTARARSAVVSPKRTSREFALLLSPGADTLLEEMAIWARNITLERFGRTMQLYAPLYLSNRCVGSCPYCGFSAKHKIARRALSIAEVRREASLLRESGIQSILLVAGDDPKHVDIDFLTRAIQTVLTVAPSVSVEVAPLSRGEYLALAAAGADGVTLYQETYHRDQYAALHAGTPKEGFDNRLTALSRAGEAGFSKLNVGALWGLSAWREEALKLGIHARLLETHYWRSHVSLGLPRLKQVPEGFEIPCPIDDRTFVHIITALRLFLNDAGLVLSTRESATLRSHLIGLGITQMSAGSCTKPGGYADADDAGEQFQVADERSPREVADALTRAGYEPVWKNWDRVFIGGNR